MKHLVFVRLIALLLLCASAAFSQPREPAARSEAYRQGYAAIERRDWAAAQRLFDELFSEEPTYDVALHLGQAEYQLGRYRDAAEHLAFGVKHLPPGESDELRERGVLALEVARSKVGTLEISVNEPSAEVHIDGVLIGTTPMAGERFVVPGRHRVEALLPGHRPASKMIEIRAGEQQEVVLELVPVAKPSSPSVARPPSADGESVGARSKESSGLEPREIVLAAGLGLTGIAAATTVVFTLKSSSAADREEELRKQVSGHGVSACASSRSTKPAVCAELDDAVDERTAASQVAYVSLGLAGAAAIATAIVYFTWPDETAGTALRPTIVPLVDSHSSGLYVTGSF